MMLAKQNDERVVKTYHCTRWGWPKLDGHLTVTTERVIFSGALTLEITDIDDNTTTHKTTNRIAEEAELKSISGLSSFYGTKINWVWLVLGLLVAFGSLMGFITSCGALTKASWMPAEMIALSVLGLLFSLAFLMLGVVIVIKLAFGKAFFLNIYSAQSAGTPINIGNTDRANVVLLSLCGMPTDQTDDMMEELGALIIDLKTDKEVAYKAWKA